MLIEPEDSLNKSSLAQLKLWRIKNAKNKKQNYGHYDCFTSNNFNVRYICYLTKR